MPRTLALWSFLVLAPACWSKPSAPAELGNDSSNGGCPKICTRCDAGVCYIDAPSVGDVVCPAGMPCVVNCTDSTACGTVDCSTATMCTINCDADGACSFGVKQCAPSGCTINCNFQNTCQNTTFDCNYGHVCSLYCFGADSCNYSTVQVLESSCGIAACGLNACAVRCIATPLPCMDIPGACP